MGGLSCAFLLVGACTHNRQSPTVASLRTEGGCCSGAGAVLWSLAAASCGGGNEAAGRCTKIQALAFNLVLGPPVRM